MTTILKKGSSSDYITIKKQTTISGFECNNTNNTQTKKQFTTMMGNYNYIDTTNNSLRNAASFDLFYTLRKGNKNCCDISTNSVLR
jgi:hypothetical protein